MSQEFRKAANASFPNPGPFLAKVVSHLDPSYMGTLEVQLIHESGNDEDREGQLRTVKYLNPFYGTTSFEFVGDDPDTHDQTQKAYGMWFVPPDVGTIVACIFIGGDTRKGFWFGCVQDEDMNFEIPGYAATSYVVDDSRKTNTEKTRVPVSEYNKIIHSEVQSDTTKKLKPEHPLAKFLEDQGLLKDDIRGITTSSGRREVPSMVFGISTPGPIDKAGKQGKVGKWEHKHSAYVSRLGGSSFVMDDGDDKWEREKTPSEGPPIYKSVENGETGLRDRPHNELIRFRTRTGHQILLHNSEDLIYIGNSRGTAWIELTSDGKIDIYAEDSISVRTKQDFNFYADRDFNLEAGRNINIKAGKEIQTEAGTDYNLLVGANGKITLGSNFDVNAGGHIWETSGGTNETKAGGNIVETAPQIHMNGPTASTAVKVNILKTHTLPDLAAQDSKTPVDLTTILRRVPTAEPYPHHENLDPLKVKSDKTDRDKEGRNNGKTEDLKSPAETWKEYTTNTDTFAKVGSSN